MHAEAVGLQPHGLAIEAGKVLTPGDGDGLGQDALGVMVNGANLATRRQGTVGQIGAIGEGFQQATGDPGGFGQSRSRSLSALASTISGSPWR